MTRRRRVILQMTPLLDLLLVVIFAQFMDLQNTSRRMLRQEQTRSWRARGTSLRRLRREQDQRGLAEGLRDRAMASMKQITDQLAPLAAQKKKFQTEAEALARQNAALQTKVRGLTEENYELAKKIDEKVALHAQAVEKARQEAQRKAEAKARQEIASIGAVFREMLNVDDKYIKSALAGRSAAEISTIAGEFKTLRETQKTAAIIRHLRKAVEFRKRCDFWEFHIADDDSVRIKIRGKVIEPKLFFRNADDFTTQVLEIIRNQEDPKDMVLILHSYGNARWATRKAVRAGMANVVKFLDADWKRSRRLHLANMGYSQEAP